MAKTAQEKAFDDLDKAVVSRDKAVQKAEELRNRYEEANTSAIRAERVVKHAATHPDLPDDFDLDTWLASRNEAPADEPTEDDEPDVFNPSGAGATDDFQEYAVGEGQLALGDDPSLEEEREFQEGAGGDGAVPEPAKKTRKAREQKQPPAPAPAVDADEDPWGDAES